MLRKGERAGAGGGAGDVLNKGGASQRCILHDGAVPARPPGGLMGGMRGGVEGVWGEAAAEQGLRGTRGCGTWTLIFDVSHSYSCFAVCPLSTLQVMYEATTVEYIYHLDNTLRSDILQSR